VERGVVEATAADLAIEEGVDLSLEDGPPVDGGSCGQALLELPGVAVEQVVTDRHEQVVEGGEVAVEVALGRARRGCDVLDPALLGT
jgi:hypothetical protein